MKRTIANFKKEHGFTNEEMNCLRECYESPFNEYEDLEYVDWLYTLAEEENGDVLFEIIADFHDDEDAE